ncbi:MAG: energy transducer TonB [Muribaculaceae bacterium]|nr:energy transducer TonB [Muribaculaceae bacterium]
MTKEINLSSREWCDLVFEGKNKDFGAYVIRTDSPRRHTRAVVYTVIGALLLGLLTFGLLKVNEYMELKHIADMAELETVFIDVSQEAEEPEPKQEVLEQEEPEALEDVVSSVRVTELQIVDDDKVRPEDEILSQDEKEETNKVFSQTNVDNGQDDRMRYETAKHEVVVEAPAEKPKEVVQEVFRSVEQMPQFPGGETALMKYLQSHINYPPMAAENNVQGRVVVQFVVDKTGKVGEVKIVRSVDKDLDKEAARVCASLPKFTPGRQNGQAVSVWYTLPVTFKLQGTN